MWCGQFNRGFSQNQDPAAATAIELAAEVARYGLLQAIAVAAEQESAIPAQVSGPDPGDRGAAPSPLGWPEQPPLRSRPEQPPPQGRPELPPEPGRQPAWRVAALIALAGACVVGGALALLAAGSPGASGMAAGHGDGGQGSVMRTVHVTASRVAGIDFQGVPGQLTIVGGESSQAILIGQLHGLGRAPALQTRFDRAAGVLTVSVRCAPGSSCTENLRLAVPAGARAVVRQPGGSVAVTGLSGSLSITAADVDISASGLRSPDLTAVITRGRLNAVFTAPPRQVSITLASAQAALRMPARAAYRVTQEVTSGHVDVAIPEAGNAIRAVTARIDHGELDLLPS